MVANGLALATPSLYLEAVPIQTTASVGGADHAFPGKRTHRHISRPSLQLLALTSDDCSAICETLISPTSSDSPNDKDRPWQFHVAPMQGYTSYPLRKLFHCLSRDLEEDDDERSAIVLWTEMEKCEDLLGTNQNGWEKRFGTPNGGNGKSCDSCILQLGGSDPDLVKECIYRAAEYGYTSNDFCGINLNCGCPSIEAGGAATYGASLIRKPELTGRLVEAVSEAVQRVWGMDCGVEVSVKTRIGAVDTPEDLLRSTSIEDEQNSPLSSDWNLDKEQYASLKHYITSIQKGGADHVILHARPAVLSGLSPVKNRIVPKLDYRAVERVANDFPGMRVTLNGGIGTFADLKTAMNSFSGGTSSDGKGGVASHMAGRWMLRRPCDLATMGSQLVSSGRQRQDANILATNAVESYMNYLDQALGRLGQGDEATPTKAELFLPLYLVVEQIREDYDFSCERIDLDNGELDEHFMTIETIEEIYEIIVEHLLQQAGDGRGGAGKRKKSKIPAADEYNFKKLAGSFKGIVGTKVANKWRRNRAEL